MNHFAQKEYQRSYDLYKDYLPYSEKTTPPTQAKESIKKLFFTKSSQIPTVYSTSLFNSKIDNSLYQSSVGQANTDISNNLKNYLASSKSKPLDEIDKKRYVSPAVANTYHQPQQQKFHQSKLI